MSENSYQKWNSAQIFFPSNYNEMQTLNLNQESHHKLPATAGFGARGLLQMPFLHMIQKLFFRFDLGIMRCAEVWRRNDGAWLPQHGVTSRGHAVVEFLHLSHRRILAVVLAIAIGNFVREIEQPFGEEALRDLAGAFGKRIHHKRAVVADAGDRPAVDDRV